MGVSVRGVLSTDLELLLVKGDLEDGLFELLLQVVDVVAQVVALVLHFREC